MRHLLLFFSCSSFALSACGSVEKAPPPEAPPAPEVPPEAPLPRISGDEQVPDRFRVAFGRWLREDSAKVYQRVVSVSEVSNAVDVVLERKIESEGSCRIGPSTLAITEKEGGGDPKVDVQHFGEDCCPGTTCEMAPESWNLRYLNAVAAKDMNALAALVTAKKKLAYELSTPDGVNKKSYSKKDVAAGKLKNPPGCGFTDSRPRCEPGDPKGGFVCFCDGGGYHVVYGWTKEGDGFVLTSISESSH